MIKQYIDNKKYNSNFWSEQFKSYSIEDLTRTLESSEIWRIIGRYLNKSDLILDGGCALGQWVMFLTKKGYNITGCENSESLINRTKQDYPELKIIKADIRSLDFPEDYFDVYLLLGVLEHFEYDMDKILYESRRVLKESGFLIISVPYSNFFRSITFKRTQNNKRGSIFYQYIFRRSEFRELLQKHEFKVIKLIPISTEVGIEKKIPQITRVKESIKSFDSKRMKKIFPYLHKIWDFLLRFLPKILFSQMIIAVCINEDKE